MSPTRPLFFADSASAAIEAPLAATVGLGLLFAALMLAESLWPLARRPVEARGRLFANFGMGVLNFGLTALLPLSIPAVALLAESRSWGLLNLIGAPFWVAAPATVLAASLAQYAFHRAAHAWPPLWRLHRAHHCDTAVDLSTTLRNHPLELLAIVPWLSAVALVLGLSPAVLGPDVRHLRRSRPSPARSHAQGAGTGRGPAGRPSRPPVDRPVREPPIRADIDATA